MYKIDRWIINRIDRYRQTDRWIIRKLSFNAQPVYLKHWSK